MIDSKRQNQDLHLSLLSATYLLTMLWQRLLEIICVKQSVHCRVCAKNGLFYRNSAFGFFQKMILSQKAMKINASSI